MKRDLNLDVIRCTAIILVLCQHFLTGSGVYSMNIVGIPGFVMSCLRALFMNSVPLFILLSGYLCCNKEFSFRFYFGLIRIYVVYVLVSILCIAFKAVYMEQAIDVHYVMGALLNHYANDYSWYVTMYTGLFLLMPFINLIYKHLPGRTSKLALIFTLVYLEVVPTICNIKLHIYDEWWSNLYPLLYYFIGAYIREYKPRIKVGKAFLLLAAMVLAFGAMNFYECRGGVFVWAPYNYYDGFQSLLGSVAIFLLISNMDFSRCGAFGRKCVEKLSLLSFTIYLISYISDTVIYDVLRANVESLAGRMWYLPLTVGASLIVSFVAAWILDFPVKYIENFIKKCLLKIEEKYLNSKKTALS